MLHAPPQIAASDCPLAAGVGASIASRFQHHRPRHCPECLSYFTPLEQWRTLFCCPKHRQAFANRQTVRGRQLTAWSLARYVTRNGSRRNKDAGKKAAAVCDATMQKWIVEDREAGRMAMDDYIAERLRLGFGLEL